MNFKFLFKLAFTYFATLIISTGVCISFFWLDFFYFSDVLFLKSHLIFFIIVFLLSIVLLYIRNNFLFFEFISYRDIIIIILLFYTLNNFIYGSVAFNTSRSVSVMIVGHLYKNQERVITEDQINSYILQLYFNEEDAVHRRLLEQIKIGNIEVINGGYKLTSKGVMVVYIMGLITSAYNTEKNYAK